MKARIKPRDSHLPPDMRQRVRLNLRNIARLVLIEDFAIGASGEILPRILERADAILRKYDTLYPNVRDEQEALARRLYAEKIEYIPTRGSGYKVELSAEHTVFVLSVLLSLRKEKDRFGKIRLNRFITCINKKINYYNDTFAGTNGAGFEVIRDRLKRYGSTAD